MIILDDRHKETIEAALTNNRIYLQELIPIQDETSGVEVIGLMIANIDAALSALTQQPPALGVETWQPVPDGEYCGGRVTIGENGSEIYMDAIDAYGIRWPTEAFWGDDYRLCRAIPVESQPILTLTEEEIAALTAALNDIREGVVSFAADEYEPVLSALLAKMEGDNVY